jgi:hypothetical protein
MLCEVSVDRPDCRLMTHVTCVALTWRAVSVLPQVLPQCAAGTWRCPWCRDLCNCSGAGCLRLSRAWGKTGQLHHEARDLRYASVSGVLGRLGSGVQERGAEKQAGAPTSWQHTHVGQWVSSSSSHEAQQQQEQQQQQQQQRAGENHSC